jgi:hypothetical protein
MTWVIAILLFVIVLYLRQSLKALECLIRQLDASGHEQLVTNELLRLPKP